jgi:NADPH:quinone reductase-like Zn-dependent oxidoreductase
MRAIVHERYAPPSTLELREVARPSVGPEDILVRVRAASLNAGDWYAVTGLLVARLGQGLRRPRSPGVASDLAGVVEAVGADVTAFSPGDDVFGMRGGALAEYVTVPQERALVQKATEVSFEDAAAIPVAALTALQALRDHGRLEPGQRVLVNGASGGVGTFAVQIAKALGAEVTAVCSTRNVETAWSLGADDVVDYTREDFTRSGTRHDLVLDVAGSRSWRELRRVLTPHARVVVIGAKRGNRVLGPLAHVVRMRLASVGSSQTMVFFIAKPNRDDLAFVQQLVVDGKVRPVIERRYELADAPEALTYLGEGHARGKLVVTI